MLIVSKVYAPLLALSLIFAWQSKAESPAGQSISNSSSSSSAVKNAPRDAGAVQQLKLALEAMGGIASWEKIRTIEMKGTSLASTPHSEKVSFRWLDAWKGRYIFFRRENYTNSSAKPYIYSPGNPPRASIGKKNLPVQTFSLPSPHIPAAVFIALLHDQSCSITSGKEPGSVDPSNVTFVDVQCPIVPGLSLPVRQRWEFSSQTNLPLSVKVFNPEKFNGIEGVPYTLWKYSHFANHGDVQTPDDITIQHGHIFTTTVHINSVNLPEKVNLEDYKEAK